RDGHEVITASDGGNGLLLFKYRKPDLVILDRELPVFSGSKVLKKIREISRDVPVLVLTGFDNPEDADRYRQLGASAFISKGSGMVSLLEELKKLMPTNLETGHAADRPTQTAPERSKILVVDDEESVRRVLVRFLGGKGYEVIEARDGEEAVGIMNKEKPDLVLLDINMPKKNGVQTLKEIRAGWPETGVIMLTGNEELELAHECMKAGAADYISKPFNFEYLETSIMTKLFTQM
ncbi:MAG: response regulator, partial [bacterium]